MSDNTFTCVACGGVFEKGWTDEEAKAEFAINYPGMDLNEGLVVCDDCWKLSEDAKNYTEN